MRTFDIRPYDDEGEIILYKNPHFEFKPGITILLGCNGAGKTTLMRRMIKLLDAEKIPTWSLLKQRLTRDIEARQYFTGDVETLMQMVSRSSVSEGEFAKSQFSLMLKGLGNAIVNQPHESNERWVFMDGMDSSLSEDQLDQVNDLFETVIETAPDGVDVYLIATTNQFALAKNRHCILVTNGKTMTPKTYASYRNTILNSAKQRQNAREISETTWDRKYSKMTDVMHTSEETTE